MNDWENLPEPTVIGNILDTFMNDPEYEPLFQGIAQKINEDFIQIKSSGENYSVESVTNDIINRDKDLYNEIIIIIDQIFKKKGQFEIVKNKAIFGTILNA